MTKKNSIIIGIFILIGLLLLAVFFVTRKSADVGTSLADLTEVRRQYPEWSQFIDDIEKWDATLQEDATRPGTYLTLALAWKSLADRTRNTEHYEQALRLYEHGVELTERKDTTFLTNAAKMATYTGDFVTAESYFNEAITVAPGDTDIYIWLAELYEYQMKKPADTIVSLLDRGIARAMTSEVLKEYKADYLARTK